MVVGHLRKIIFCLTPVEGKQGLKKMAQKKKTAKKGKKR